MPQTSRRILVLYAHPQPDRSQTTAALARDAWEMDGVDVVDLYAEYPDMGIDPDLEQARLDAHEVIIFLFPVF